MVNEELLKTLLHRSYSMYSLVTNLIPDLCLFWETSKQLIIVELTVAFELNINDAHNRKMNKYAGVVSDIQSHGFQCDIIALEIGSRGYVSPDNQNRLKQILKLSHNPVKFKKFRDDISKLSILSSFAIYHTHNEPSWDGYPLLTIS